MLSAQCKRDHVHVIEKLTFTLMFIMSVILALRTYAFTGKKTVFLAVLSIFFLCIMGVMVWVTTTQLSRLS